MAETDTGQDRTEEATPKRIADARKKGDVPRSRELNTVLMLLVSIVGLAFLGGAGTQAYRELTIKQWQIERQDLFNNEALLNGLYHPLIEALWIAAPFLFVMFIAAFVGPLVMGGWVFSWTAAKFDIKKLSPLAGIKRMFGVQSLAELGKAILKVILLGTVAVYLLQTSVDKYIGLSTLPLEEAVGSMFRIVFMIVLILVLTLIGVVVVDVPYQKWSYAKKLRMTLQEVRDENKEQLGNPEVKSRIRQLQNALTNKRMLSDVPSADVIIVNPTHYAVALKYEEGSTAPVVVAKGIDFLALKIREIGQNHDVEIFSAPALARSLYRHTEVGENIPSELYLAVAQILAYVLQVKEMSFSERRRINPPTDLPVPTSFQVP